MLTAEIQEHALPQVMRAIRAAFPEEIAFGTIRSRPWSSTSFRGAKHEIEVKVRQADEADALLAGAAYHLRGHVLADLVVADRQPADGRTILMIEALTVEDEGGR